MSIAQFIILSNGKQVEVPPGADPNTVRRVEEARLRLATNPPKKTSRHSRSRRPRKRRPFQNSVPLSGAELQTRRRAAAKAALVERVNDQEEGAGS